MYKIVLFKDFVLEYENEIILMDKTNISNNYNIEKWNKLNFEYNLPEKDNLSFIILLEHIIIGYIICSKKETNLYHIHRFCIDKLYQKNGYGKILLNHLILVLKEQNNLFKLSLYVHKNNINALKFYLKNEFKINDKFNTNENIFMEFIN